MKVRNIDPEPIKEVSWESGAKPKYAAVSRTNNLAIPRAIAVFDNKYWADKFVESINVSCTVMEIVYDT